MVQHFDAFLGLFVRFGIRFCFLLHARHFFFAEAAGCFDADVLFLARRFVLGADLDDAVGIDVERHLNLWYSARCRGDVRQLEPTDGAVVVRHGTLALQHVDFNAGLVIRCGAERFGFLGGDGRVGVDQLGHHATHGFNAQRQRSHVEQQHVLDVTGEDTALNGCTYGYDFVRVHALRWLFTEVCLDCGLNRGDARRTAYQNHFVDVRLVEVCSL